MDCSTNLLLVFQLALSISRNHYSPPPPSFNRPYTFILNLEPTRVVISISLYYFSKTNQVTYHDYLNWIFTTSVVCTFSYKTFPCSYETE